MLKPHLPVPTIDHEMMVMDPVAIHLRQVAQQVRPEQADPQRVEAGHQLALDGLKLAIDIDRPTLLDESNIDGHVNSDVGLMRYQTREGDAYLWVRASYRLADLAIISAAEDRRVVVEDVDEHTVKVSLMAHTIEPERHKSGLYGKGRDLFTMTPHHPVAPHGGETASIEDENFLRQLMGKMRRVYKPKLPKQAH